MDMSRNLIDIHDIIMIYIHFKALIKFNSYYKAPPHVSLLINANAHRVILNCSSNLHKTTALKNSTKTKKQQKLGGDKTF